MKIFEIFYIVGLFLIIFSVAFYFLSTTALISTDEESVSNLTGENAEIDSTIAMADGVLQFREMKRERNIFVLWIGIPLGMVVFLTGVVVKRKKEGPDRFIDIEDDDEEFFLSE